MRESGGFCPKALSHSVVTRSYLGQVYERTGKRDQAINEYQDFLSYFVTSHTQLSRISEARTALKRLMQ